MSNEKKRRLVGRPVKAAAGSQLAARVGAHLRARRLEQKQTLESLVCRSGGLLTLAGISNQERGVEMLPAVKLRALLTLLGCRLDQVVDPADLSLLCGVSLADLARAVPAGDMDTFAILARCMAG